MNTGSEESGVRGDHPSLGCGARLEGIMEAEFTRFKAKKERKEGSLHKPKEESY